MDDRLTKLELLYLEQSRMVEDLSGELFQQQREIARLTLDMNELKDKLDAATQEIGGSERPPHY